MSKGNRCRLYRGKDGSARNSPAPSLLEAFSTRKIPLLEAPTVDV